MITDTVLEKNILSVYPVNYVSSTDEKVWCQTK